MAGKYALEFCDGELRLQVAGGDGAVPEQLQGFFQLDSASGGLSSVPAYLYADVVLKLRELAEKVHCDDQARRYRRLALKLRKGWQPRKHQLQALEAWQKQRGRGCCVLPTGAGKTYLACMAMAAIQRSSCVVVPTIDLLQQWREVLFQAFGVQAGIWGGGEKRLAAITVITYDSARSVMAEWGNLFGLVIFDECHHLVAPLFRSIARSCLAPYRLGLTATPEREDGAEEYLWQLVGPKVYEASLLAITGKVLAPYDVMTLEVPLNDEERTRYTQERSLYLSYVRAGGWSFQRPGDWQRFVVQASRSYQGRRALQAYRIQRRISLNAAAKVRALWKIFEVHAQEKILIFTHDNDLAYKIGLTYFLPVLTHQTKKSERRQMLEMFREGSVHVLVTSRVLNEGIDVPEASVGVVVSGSGSVREHVQRLGRILRHRPGKRAKLYELISQDTGEFYTNKRRRRHDAYQRAVEVPPASS